MSAHIAHALTNFINEHKLVFVDIKSILIIETTLGEIMIEILAYSEDVSAACNCTLGDSIDWNVRPDCTVILPVELLPTSLLSRNKLCVIVSFNFWKTEHKPDYTGGEMKSVSKIIAGRVLITPSVQCLYMLECMTYKDGPALNELKHL